jgi:nicotinamidase/pyrazinamidase
LAQGVWVRATVLDAAREGFETHVIQSATRAINAAGRRARALAEMAQAGAIIEWREIGLHGNPAR